MPDTSAQSAHGYVLGHADAELQRLAEQAAFYADLTENAFRRAGLVSGMHVLDVGCGAGDVSLLVADLVGPSGMVVGIDRSPQAIDTARRRAAAAGITHARFEVAEIDALPPETVGSGFDAVVGRLVLLYQPDPVAAVRGLVRLVRPGGIVAFQEMAMHTARSLPQVPAYQRSVEWIITLYERAGLEADMGSKLFSTLLRAGLAAPEMIGSCRVEGGAESPAYRYMTETVRSLLPMLERLGVATAAEIDIDTLEARMRAEAVTGACCLVLPTLIAAWARTPS